MNLPVIFRKDVSGKIERAILKKKCQLVAMYLVGIIVGASYLYSFQELKVLFAERDKAEIIFENHFALKAEAEEVVAVPERDLVDYIFLRESSRGVKNYSKCEAIGKYNRYGFGIDGSGTYVCFDKDEDTKAVAGWIAYRKALGWSEEKMLSVYSGGSYTK